MRISVTKVAPIEKPVYIMIIHSFRIYIQDAKKDRDEKRAPVGAPFFDTPRRICLFLYIIPFAAKVVNISLACHCWNLSPKMTSVLMPLGLLCFRRL